VDAHEKWRLENLRRSIAMLGPGQLALDREQALELIEQLQTSTKELEHAGTAEPDPTGTNRTGTDPLGGAATRLPGLDGR
jgi:hypothetical protein